MEMQTGESYATSKYLKALVAAESKVGKTVWLAASLLGVLPWQKEGGVVSSPEDLYFITFDSAALAGARKFLTQSCGAPPEALKYRVYNLQDDARRVAEGTADYDHSLFGQLVDIQQDIHKRIRSGKVSAVVMSSLTGLALAVERGMMGPPTGSEKTGKGYGSIDKWKMLSAQLFDLQNKFQVDDWHMLWEGHIYTPPKMGADDSDGGKPTLQVSGKAGVNWAYNVEQCIRLRRNNGTKVKGTSIDEVYMDTKPTGTNVLANGRMFNELLADREVDLTVVCRKLGLKTGNWGAKSAPPKAVKK